MPLGLLIIMVVAGVAAVVFAVSYSGISRSGMIDGEDHARSVFARHYPDEEPTQCLCTPDGQAAFLALQNGQIGLVSVFGARYVCRVFEPGEVRFRVEEDGAIALRFPDFGFPRGRYTFAQAAEAERLARWLEGETDGGGRSRLS